MPKHRMFKKYQAVLIALSVSFGILQIFFVNASGISVSLASGINLAQRQIPMGNLYNSSCSQVSPSALTWFETYNPVKSNLNSSIWDAKNAFGVQRADGWFYLWNVVSPSASNCNDSYTVYAPPTCSVPLKNALGQNVPGSSLIFLGMADLDGIGTRNYLVAIQATVVQGTPANWLLAWRVDLSPGCPSGLKLVVSGQLLNTLNVAVPGNLMRYVVLGNFDGSGSDQLRVLQAHTSYNYTWKIHSSTGQIQLIQNGNLNNHLGASVNVDDLTFVDVADEDTYGTNFPGQSYLTAIQSGAWGYQWTLAPNSANEIGFCTGTNCTNKTLIFSLDEGFANGITRYISYPAMAPVYQNIIGTLKQFQTKYKVYALLNPIFASAADKQNLFSVLDYLKANNIPFILDVKSSDNTMIGLAEPAITEVSNISYGLGPLINDVPGVLLPAVTLEDINSRYGSFFAGIRIMEAGAQDYSENFCIQNSITQGACGVLRKNNNLVPDYFNLSDVEPYVQFAYDNSKHVLVTDQLWVAPWDTGQAWLPTDSIYRFRAGIGALALKYPNTLVVAYDNNESYGNTTRSGLHRMNNWSQYLQQFPGVAGIALSNQSWMCDRKPGFDNRNCPPEYMALWANNAFLSNSAMAVQFEPFWYLFAWPSGMEANSVPTSASTFLPASPPAVAGAGLGSPTVNLCVVAASLGVALTNCP